MTYELLYQEVFVFLTDYSKILYMSRLGLRLRFRLRGNGFPQHHIYQYKTVHTATQNKNNPHSTEQPNTSDH